MKRPIRIVTAASLFDGHDASINIIRRLIQDGGAEVIHLGHNRSVRDIVVTAIQEGAQGICVSSYQGGHMEFFKYMKDLLKEYGAPYIKIFGGGGGVIVHEEKVELEKYGISRIFHPDDGRRLGLEGMIKEILTTCDFDILAEAKKIKRPNSEFAADVSLGLCLTAQEQGVDIPSEFKSALQMNSKSPPVIGVTGTGGAGKSSLVDELIQRFLNAFTDIRIAVLCVDPSKRKTGGALLGDRIRMNSLSRKGVFMRSIASRGSGHEIAASLPTLLKFTKDLDFDLVIVETSGIGQNDSKITEISDFSLYVMTSEFGAQSQLEKIDMIDFASFISINKADRRGSEDALRDVRKQYRRSRRLFEGPKDEDLPVFLTRASQFNDVGVHQLFFSLCKALSQGDKKFEVPEAYKKNLRIAATQVVIPPDRTNYLAEIVKVVRDYKEKPTKKRSWLTTIKP